MVYKATAAGLLARHSDLQWYTPLKNTLVRSWLLDETSFFLEVYRPQNCPEFASTEFSGNAASPCLHATFLRSGSPLEARWTSAVQVRTCRTVAAASADNLQLEPSWPTQTILSVFTLQPYVCQAFSAFPWLKGTDIFHINHGFVDRGVQKELQEGCNCRFQKDTTGCFCKPWFEKRRPTTGIRNSKPGKLDKKSKVASPRADPNYLRNKKLQKDPKIQVFEYFPAFFCQDFFDAIF